MTTATTPARTARTRRSIRVVPAVALASAVIVVSVAGSATAAKMITGKQIKNGSITSVDVRNNNLTGADLKNGTVGSADLKDGTVGSADLANNSVGRAELGDAAVGSEELEPGSVGAEQLAPGLASQVSFFSEGDKDIANCPDQTLVVCSSVAGVSGGGKALYTATGTLDTVSDSVPTPTRCGLVQGSTILGLARFAPNADGAPGDLVPFTLQAAVDLDNGPINLRCTQFAGDDLVIRDLKISGVSTASLYLL